MNKGLIEGRFNRHFYRKTILKHGLIKCHILRHYIIEMLFWHFNYHHSFILCSQLDVAFSQKMFKYSTSVVTDIF